MKSLFVCRMFQDVVFSSGASPRRQQSLPLPVPRLLLSLHSFVLEFFKTASADRVLSHVHTNTSAGVLVHHILQGISLSGEF